MGQVKNTHSYSLLGHNASLFVVTFCQYLGHVTTASFDWLTAVGSFCPSCVCIHVPDSLQDA